MTRTGMPHDPEPDATQHERPARNPPGSDATELDRPLSYPPGSDATQLEPPPIHAGSDATQLERPRPSPPGEAAPPFGYAPPSPIGAPPPPGYPPGTPGYGAPPYVERPEYPPGPPLSYPASGYPPPVRPPSRRRSGLIVAIIGALLVALVVIAGLVLIATHNRGATSTASGTQQARNSAASATAAPATSTPAATPSATATIAPTATAAPVASIAPALSGPTGSWTDPENRVTVRFPTDWQKETFDTRDENATLEKAQPLLQLTGPDDVHFSVNIYMSAKTLDEDVRAFLDATTSDPKFAFKPDQTQDVRVGGEAAKLLTGSYMQNGAPVSVAVWFVDHGGKRFGFSADQIGTHRSAIDAIVASITFVPAGAQRTATPASTIAATPATRPSTALATTAAIFGTPASTATRAP